MLGWQCVPPSGPRSKPLIREPALSAPGEPALAEPSSGDQRAPGALEALILKRLDDDKAQDVIFIDLHGKSSFADSLIVASGRSNRHVSALADHLLRALKDEGFGKCRVEGLPHSDWVLIDAGDVIIHLFRPEVRAFYNIEKILSVEPPKPALAN